MARVAPVEGLGRVAWLSAVAAFLSGAMFGPAAVCGREAESELARQILEATGVRGGLVVHVGCGDGKLTAALRANDRFLVHGLDTDPAQVAAAREYLRSLGVYGNVSVGRWSGRRLPYAENLVNLLVAEDEDLGDLAAGEIERVLAPRGAAYVKRDGQWGKTVKPWPARIDEWTHWLHGPDGNAVARDELAGPPRGLQWIAGPLWSRHHNTVPSVTAWVSAGGRVFCIVDEAPPGVNSDLPDKWALVARDAFNGLLLWRIPLPDWGWRAWSADWHCRFTVPTHIPRRLVASGERLYATLGFNAPLSEIDAATGEVLREFQGTRFTDEILHDDGLLILSINREAQRPDDLAEARKDDAGEAGEAPVRKSVAALDVETGRVLWKTGDYVGLRSKTGSMERISHLSPVAGGGRVFFVDGDRLVALDLKSGNEAWRVPRPEVPEHKMRYNIRITDMCSLVYHDGLVFFAQLDPDRRIDWRQIRGKLHAFSAATGEALWSRPCASWGWGHPADVFAVGGLVWVHDFETPNVLGLDPATGEVKQKTSNFKAFDNGHHHRCYRNKATERWLMTSYRGLEFIPWAGGETPLNHWVRGTCRLGAFPCNGLVYATPHPCNCYITAKLNGFVALAPEPGNRGDESGGERLERGPAFGKSDIHPSSISIHPSDDWPTYRHDPQRSGTTQAALGADLEPLWETDLGAPPTACTVADGKVFTASLAAHEVCALNADGGRPLWRFVAGGPVDTPPTIARGRAVFGCRDGYVYCLRASDGRLAWRFRAAPCERLVGAFGRLESAWPVYGSVLVQNGRIYFTAGRSSFLDGGIWAYCLDLESGKVLDEQTVATARTMPVDTGRDQSKYYGALSDVLVGDGGAVLMRGLPLFGELDGASRASARGLRSTAGMLDDSWFNRAHWFADGKPRGELLICDERTVYGVRAYATMDANAGFFKPGGGYQLFAQGRERPAGASRPANGPPAGNKKNGRGLKWSVRVPVRVTGMVLAGDTLFAAGTPDLSEPDDPWAAYEGRRGGVLVALSAADGKRLSGRQLDAPPVFDGLSAASGRLYLSTTNGHVVCFGPKAAQ